MVRACAKLARALRPRDRAVLLVLTLAVLALAPLPNSAGAQTPPMWEPNSDGTKHILTLDRSSVTTVGAFKCALWPGGSPVDNQLVQSRCGILRRLWFYE